MENKESQIEELEEFLDEGSKKKLPVVLRIFAILLIVYCALNIASAFYALYIFISDAISGAYKSYGASTITCEVGHLACTCLLVITSLVFGIMLLRGKRRRAAVLIYLLGGLTLLDVLFALMIFGIGWNIIAYACGFAILVCLQIYLDPSLSDERKLQRKLMDADIKKEQEEGTLGFDQTKKGLIDINFFNLFWIFVVSSILGLGIEVIYHYFVVVPGEIQDRAGLLFGPFSPIYGCGAVLITLLLNRLYKYNFLVIFACSAVIGGAFEVFVAYFMEFMFGGVAWNYSDQPLSIAGGRTCGMFMVMWGLLGVFWLKAVLPDMIKIFNKIPWNFRYAVTSVCTVLIAVDIVMTLQSLDCWYMRLANDPSSIANTPIAQFYGEHFDNEYMQARFESMTIQPDNAVRSNSF